MPRPVCVRPDPALFEPPSNEGCSGAPDDDQVSLVETGWGVCRLGLGDTDDLGVERVEEEEGVCDSEGCGELWGWRERWDE